MIHGRQEDEHDPAAVETIKKYHIDCVISLGSGGTQKNGFHLYKDGGNSVLTLPKTLDDDVAKTDITLGFDTAMNIAAEAIHRLHNTATGRHRIIVCEFMGHNSGWLALGAGIAGCAGDLRRPWDTRSAAAARAPGQSRRQEDRPVGPPVDPHGAAARDMHGDVATAGGATGAAGMPTV
jgi:6-phosphofructokinase 1